MTKKQVLLRIVLPVVVALFVGGLFVLRAYLQPFTRTAEFTVCGVHGETYEISMEVCFHRWLLAPTGVRAAVTVDGTTYKTFELARGTAGSSWSKPDNGGFWGNLQAKWQERQTSVVLQAYDGGDMSRENTVALTLFSGDPFGEDTEQICLAGLAVDDGFEIAAVWFSGGVFTTTTFGPAASIEEAAQIRQGVFGFMQPFAN